MKKRLRLMPILMAIMMVFTMMPMMIQTVYADNDPVYTVTLDPGEGSGDPIVFKSDVNWYESTSGNGSDVPWGYFYRYLQDNTIYFRFPNFPDTFTAPEYHVFDEWTPYDFSPGGHYPISGDVTFTAQWKKDPNYIGNYEVSFDDQYLVEDDDPFTPYTEYFYEVPSGTDLSPIVSNGDTVLDSNCYKASYSEMAYDEETHEYSIKDDNVWQDEFPTTPGVYICGVEGVSPYYGTYEGIIHLIRIIDLKDIGNYEVSFDDEYLVLDDDPVTPYPEFFYDVPAGKTLDHVVARGTTVLDPDCYKASYSEVYFNEEKYEYNIIDDNVWQYSFPTKTGVYFCKVEGKDPYYGSFEWMPLIRITTDISKDKVELSKASFVYNGKVQKPSVKTVGGKTLKEGKDYTVSWSNASSKNAGTYTVTVKGKGIYKGTTKATYTIAKAANPLTIKAKTATVKGSTKGKNGKLKKTKTLAVSKVIAFTKNGQGKMTYTKASGNKKITINKTTGKVTVKKGLKKGTYKIKVKVKAAGNTNYKASAVKTVTFKVKVK